MELAKVIPPLHSGYIEDAATQVLRDYGIIFPHQIDLEQIISNYKSIKVFHMDQDSKAIIRKNNAILIISNSLNYREQRQQLAEEFCHALLHTGNQMNFSDNLIVDKQENQAKRMAAYLLCPLYILKKISVSIETYALISELSDIFQVTEEFMKYRLSLIFGVDLKIVPYHRGNAYGFIQI